MDAPGRMSASPVALRPAEERGRGQFEGPGGPLHEH